MDYGGVFDLFCKLKALHDSGIRITLHCFEYGRGRQPELNKYCEEVYYYHRNEGHKGFSTHVPYIVCSRSNPLLAENLLRDQDPILLEGVHCTFMVDGEPFRNRKMILRLHNVEFEYYRHLFHHSSSLWRKLYYYNESRLLKKYESKIAKRLEIVAVSQKDALTYRDLFHAARVHTLPVFIPWEEVRSREGIGTYCLYHGNLGVEENEKAALWLLERVFSEVRIPLVIAGKNPSARLEKLAHAQNHTCLVANPAEDEMADLISKAQINILPSFNQTGVKLKLLNALFNGRHCVVNHATVEKTGLEGACHIVQDEKSMRELIPRLYHLPYSQEEKKKRAAILGALYNNHLNSEKLISWIW
jgi:glycosyltransferase involved in cell wall biosynthesis